MEASSIASDEVEEIDINIKTQSDENFPLKVLKSIQVSELKTKVKDSTAIPEARQRLIYRGRVLQDQSCLKTYNIEDGHTVHMVARPQDSPPPSQESTTRASAGNEEAGGSGALGRRLVMGTLALPGLAFGGGGGLPSLGDMLSEGDGSGSMARDIAARMLEGRGGAANRAARVLRNTNESSGQNAQQGLNESSLEHLRQGLLTMHTLMSTQEEEEEKEESKERFEGKEDEAGHVRRSRLGVCGRNYFVGQWLDVKDTVNQWLEATVMEIRSNGDLLVHYNGWPSRWDEYLPPASPRIAPFRTRTVHAPGPNNVPTISPAPTTVVRDAPITGDDDLRLLLPEVDGMLRRVQPLLSSLAKLCEDQTEPAGEAGLKEDNEASSGGRPSGRHRMPWSSRRVRSHTLDLDTDFTVEGGGGDAKKEGEAQQTAQQAEAKPANRQSVDSDDLPDLMNISDSSDDSDEDDDRKMQGEDEKKAEDPARRAQRQTVEYTQDLIENSLELAPLLDRMGRILADLAPHLARLNNNSSPNVNEGEDNEAAERPLRPGRDQRGETTGSGPTRRSGLRRAPRPRSPSPSEAFRQLIQTPSRGGFGGPGSQGNIDIHIHAIVPLRGGGGTGTGGTPGVGGAATPAAPAASVASGSGNTNAGSGSGNTNAGSSPSATSENMPANPFFGNPRAASSSSANDSHTGPTTGEDAIPSVGREALMSLLQELNSQVGSNPDGLGSPSLPSQLRTPSPGRPRQAIPSVPAPAPSAIPAAAPSQPPPVATAPVGSSQPMAAENSSPRTSNADSTGTAPSQASRPMPSPPSSGVGRMAIGTEPAREHNSVDPRDRATQPPAPPAQDSPQTPPTPARSPSIRPERNGESATERSVQRSASTENSNDGGGLFGAFRRILGHRD